MIYIFGGAFDPPHAGHIAIIRALLHFHRPTQIVILPSGKRNDKEYNVSDEHRLKILEIFLRDIHDSRVIVDDYFIREWPGEMITRDVDQYAREKYGDDIVHIFGTDTIASMPDWDSEQYAAKKIRKIFVPRGFWKMEDKKTEKQNLQIIMEGSWCRFSPGKGGARGGYIEYNPSLLEFAKQNRKTSNNMEKDMWSVLRGEKMGYKFHRQKPIGEFIVDFYSPSLQLVIEIDGDSHIESIAYDKRRTEYINSLGIHVLRFTNSEVGKNLEGVREYILEWIKNIKEINSVTPPSLPFSGEELEKIQNFEFFTDSHIPDISSTEIRASIPEYATIHARYENDPQFMIPGLSKKISQYILQNKLYRNSPPEKGEQEGVFQRNKQTPPSLPFSGEELKQSRKNPQSFVLPQTAPLQKEPGKPKILVHVCCGPDVTMPILELRDEYDVICFWYDPNIQPKAEYDKRYEAFVKVCEIENIPYIKGAYDVKNFFSRIRGFEDTPEKGEKCTHCYDMRMYVAAKLAKRLNIPLYTSSLNTSPKKDLEKLFKMGHKYAEKYGIEFLDIPFRKLGGFEKSVAYTTKHNIYRQNYCGCVYSIRDGGGGG